MKTSYIKFLQLFKVCVIYYTRKLHYLAITFNLVNISQLNLIIFFVTQITFTKKVLRIQNLGTKGTLFQIKLELLCNTIPKNFPTLNK